MFRRYPPRSESFRDGQSFIQKTKRDYGLPKQTYVNPFIYTNYMKKYILPPLLLSAGIAAGSAATKYMTTPIEEPAQSCYRAGNKRICESIEPHRNEELDQLEKCYHILRENSEEIYGRLREK